MVAFSGRIEARITIPAGVEIVASNETQATPVTITVTAGSYYLTAAGGVSGLLETIEDLLNAQCAPTTGAWTVSLDTSSGTGRVTFACGEPAYVQFTSMVLRDALGFAYDFDYPSEPAQVTEALGGYGDFTDGAGYLCNESIGDLASAFGTPAALSPVSTPTYLNVGPRGGSDKAVGFDSTLDGWSGGNVFDVAANEDICVAWVARIAALPGANRILISKYVGGGGWQLWMTPGGYAWYGESPTSTALFNIENVAYPLNEWHVGIAMVDRSTGMARVGLCGLRTGTVTVSAETSVAASAMTAGGGAVFAVGDRNALGAAPTETKLSAFYVATGPSVATGLSANLSTALSSFAAYMKGQTGTKQAKGLVFLDCPLSMAGDPSQAPRASDRRDSESPTGFMLSLAGNTKYRHKGLVWSHVPKERVWESATTYDNASWEQFVLDTQIGAGHSWFTPGSRCQIYWANAGVDELVGSAANSGAGLSGWFLKGVSSTEPTLSQPGFTGLWRIEIPEIGSDG